MRNNSMPHFWILDIGHIVFRAGLLDDLADPGIMNVRNLGEQVVFDLEIQSANQPADELIPGREVGRCFLIDGWPIRHPAYRYLHGEPGNGYALRYVPAGKRC